MSTCCDCCGFTSLIGVVFFGITAIMVKRENTIFLSHKAGLNLHTMTQDDIDAKFLAMIYTAIVSSNTPLFRTYSQWKTAESDLTPCLFVQVFIGSMILCFSTGRLLKCREQRKDAEEEFVRARNASVAFEAENTPNSAY